MAGIGELFPPFRGPGSERWASWIFAAYLVAAAPLILFHLGSWHWFFRDDFIFIADRRDIAADLLAAHGGAHWVAVPRLAYLFMWEIAGMRSYVPYQAMVVVLHLAACAMLRLIMRRAGVGNWLASAAAAVLVLFGPGAQNIIWAFQISFTGSLAYGLAHLLLSDQKGRADWRDALGIGFGVLSLMSSGVGVTMAAVVGLSVLVRRGWRMALLHVAPLALVWGAWALQNHFSTESPFGRPPLTFMLRWLAATLAATFTGLGATAWVGVVLAGILAVGLALIWGPWRSEPRWDALRRTATPLALFLGGILFATTSGYGRWLFGLEAARAGRYVHLGAAMSLPLLAVAAQALADRWRPLVPAFVGLFMLIVPLNLSGFDPVPPFGARYMDQRRYVLTTAVRMPFAADVPADVQPIPDPYASDQLTIGFLRNAARDGDLQPSTVPVTDAVRHEFLVRLGVAQRFTDRSPSRCATHNAPLELSGARGDVILIPDPVAIAHRRGHDPDGPSVPFVPAASGAQLTFELDVDVIVQPVAGATSFRICQN